MPKVPKQAKAKRDGVINQQNYNFNQFHHRKLGFKELRPHKINILTDFKNAYYLQIVRQTKFCIEQ